MMIKPDTLLKNGKPMMADAVVDAVLADKNLWDVDLSNHQRLCRCGKKKKFRNFIIMEQ